MIITVKWDVPEQLLRDLLVTAVEGGSDYWAEYRRVMRDAELNILSVHVREQEASDQGGRHQHADITPASMALGLERLAQASFPAALTHLANALKEEGDAETADVVLQMAMFGKLIYG